MAKNNTEDKGVKLWQDNSRKGAKTLMIFMM